MKTSLAGSVKAYSSAHPPTVTFVFGVMGITLTLLIVAFNIKNNPVAYDLRLKEDWNNFMELLSKQKLCSDNFEENLSSPTDLARFSNTTFMPVTIKLSSSEQFEWLKTKSSPIVFAGNISLKGLKMTCDSVATENENVTLILVIPSKIFESSDAISSCVHFSGPTHLFLPTSLISGVPSFLTNAECSNLNISQQHAINLFSLSDQNHTTAVTTTTRTNSKFCDIENAITLSYDPKIYRPQVQLTKDEKVEIFDHLLIGVYLLLGFLCVMFLNAILQGRKLLLTTRHTLLPTKETL